jgi:hypothetical protein
VPLGVVLEKLGKGEIFLRSLSLKSPLQSNKDAKTGNLQTVAKRKEGKWRENLVTVARVGGGSYQALKILSRPTGQCVYK